MFARSVFKTAARRATTAARPANAFTPLTSRAAFSHSVKKDDPEVPVISYQNGQRQEQSLFVPAMSAGPVTPPGQDIEKAAVPLSPSIMPHLTPTLQKFTLLDKVAVVTG